MAEVRIPNPTPKYDATNQRRMNEIIENELSARVTRFEDIEVARVNDPLERVVLGNRIIVTSPDGTRYALTVDNAGVLGTVPL